MKRGTIVVAKFNEDLNWTKEYEEEWNIVVVEKDKDMPNVGREPASYLWYIVNNYDTLNGAYVFVQGDPFGHMEKINFNDFIDIPIMCFRAIGNKTALDNYQGVPNHPGIPIGEVYEKVFLSQSPEHFKFIPGCQFTIHADVIKSKAQKFYQHALAVCVSDEKAPWCFERFMKQVMS
jgi:hypothetical protein